MKQKCIFLDRDGVLNVERGRYVYELDDFEIETKIPEAVSLLKEAGYLVIIITNQAGIAKGMYGHEEVKKCHKKLQEAVKHQIDALYYAPYHPITTESFGRKPDSLLLEKAQAKFDIDMENSWMVGDKERDLEAAQKAGVTNLVFIGEEMPENSRATHLAINLYETVTKHILPG
ncbi:HAD family hydrolase [Rapidithrix thailandica]|uniref:D,D-heptose 1,7-bisphosphate phosphatase n=1 Tax=Rapidithrix thailandica TaxID=413964 RepID=A0AAW9S645_9BACT